VTVALMGTWHPARGKPQQAVINDGIIYVGTTGGLIQPPKVGLT